jgi:hypothetical protein
MLLPTPTSSSSPGGNFSSPSMFLLPRWIVDETPKGPPWDESFKEILGSKMQLFWSRVERQLWIWITKPACGAAFHRCLLHFSASRGPIFIDDPRYRRKLVRQGAQRWAGEKKKKKKKKILRMPSGGTGGGL